MLRAGTGKMPFDRRIMLMIPVAMLQTPKNARATTKMTFLEILGGERVIGTILGWVVLFSMLAPFGV
jgi:hypothetical protein